VVSLLDKAIEAGLLVFLVRYPLGPWPFSRGTLSLIGRIALASAVILWIVRWRTGPRVARVRTPIDRPLLVYSLVVLVSLLYSIDQRETLRCLFGPYATGLVLFFLVLDRFRAAEGRRRLATVLAAAFLVTVAVGLANYLNGRTNALGGITAFGIDGVHTIGKGLSGLFPFVLILCPGTGTTRRKMFGAAAILVALFGVFMTLSRGAWAGAFVTVVIWGLFRAPRLVTAVLVAFVVCVFAFGPPVLLDRLNLFRYQMATLSDRLTIWEGAMEDVAKRPLHGYGYGLRIYQNLYDRRHPDRRHDDPDATHEHSIYLALLVQTGLVGLAAFGWLFAAATTALVRGIRRVRAGPDRDLLLVALTGLIGEYMVHGLVDRNNMAKWAQPFWVLLALGMGSLHGARAAPPEPDRAASNPTVPAS